MRIVWTKSALCSWQEIAQYIYDAFGVKALMDFQQKTSEWESTILSMPCIGHIELLTQGMQEEYRSVIVHKYSKMVYAVDGECVKILAFWDTRKEPKLPMD